jgi:uncharacterized protein YprB with RNaseH-like and TPR domain
MPNLIQEGFSESAAGRVRAAFFDVETTSLKPEWGNIISGAILDNEGNPPNLLFSVPGDFADKQLCVSIRDALESYDMIIGWSSKRFDVPFLNHRLNVHYERPLNQPNHFDLQTYAVKKYRTTYRSQEEFCKAFSVPHSEPYDAHIWRMAVDEKDSDAMSYIQSKNVDDVLNLSKLYEKVTNAS